MQRTSKVVSILNNQRLLDQNCDVILKLDEREQQHQDRAVCGHFCVIAGQSQFIGGPHFQQKLLHFSISNPLTITIKNFDCFPCLQTMVEFFYENTITVNAEHEAHIRKLAKILDVTDDLFESLDMEDSSSFDKMITTPEDADMITDIFDNNNQRDYFKPKQLNEIPHLCPHCGKGFRWKQGLSSHLLIHSKEKQMLCDVCGYSTTHMKALKSHKLQHTGEFFKCTYPGCKHRANRKENLKLHIETHKRERPFVCEVCGCKFSQSKNLKRHALKHSVGGDETKKYKCQLCPFSSHRSDKLREHVQRLHTEKALQLELTETVENSFESKVSDEFNLPEICLMSDVCANKGVCDAPSKVKSKSVQTGASATEQKKSYVQHPPAVVSAKRLPRPIAPKPIAET